ncbi:hypothetical protein RIF29_28807 [Crotalaria pallida]|uniref:Uncharacterized protein n=1 Tax=Crotalaria pallida TaxID=3830 RepID=A0AAN9HTA8_CROPI
MNQKETPSLAFVNIRDTSHSSTTHTSHIEGHASFENSNTPHSSSSHTCPEQSPGSYTPIAHNHSPYSPSVPDSPHIHTIVSTSLPATTSTTISLRNSSSLDSAAAKPQKTSSSSSTSLHNPHPMITRSKSGVF